MDVTIFGSGYVGLVTGTCPAEVGHNVICVDVNAAKVQGLNNGVIPIFEPNLVPMVQAAESRILFYRVYDHLSLSGARVVSARFPAAVLPASIQPVHAR